jgi:hypothetical protein
MNTVRIKSQEKPGSLPEPILLYCALKAVFTNVTVNDSPECTRGCYTSPMYLVFSGYLFIENYSVAWSFKPCLPMVAANETNAFLCANADKHTTLAVPSGTKCF